MADTVNVEYLNETHMRVIADPGIRQELSEYFAFHPKGYQFSPKYKNKVWDGFIRLYSPMRPVLYVGLIQYLVKFCNDREYDIVIDDKLLKKEEFDDDYGFQIAKEIKSPFKPRDYQNEYVVNCLRERRALSLSPTSSGKSYIIHLIQQHYFQAFGHRTLVVVPTIGLVHQMAGDFVDYGINENTIHKIQAGKEKNTDADITISTWQSLTKMPKEWFDQFDVMIGDEAHTFAAKSLIGIMESLTACRYRFGFTGTISTESKVHKLVLEGLFGPLKKIVSTKDLIDDGTVASLRIKALILNHSKESKEKFKVLSKPVEKAQKYQAEVAYLNGNRKRNIFIRNLVWSLKDQNNLILFDRIELHGKILLPLLEKDDRVLHFIHGGIKGEERERIRHEVENDKEKRHDILASTGTFSTGINLKRLDNVIFCSGGKSEIKILQSIGRTLRKGNGADEATLYDIADVLTTTKKDNYTLEHFRKRIEIYSAESFDIKIYNVDLS